MVYLEFLRARRVFVWFAIIVIAISAFIIIGGLLGNNVNIDSVGDDGSHGVHVHGLSSLGQIAIPVEVLAALAGVCAIAFGTALAGSLNRNTQYAHFLFVRPVARYRMALLTIGTDVAAIIVSASIGFVLALATTLAVLRDHAHLVWSGETLTVLILGIGAGVMWYAMLQLFSSWSARRAGGFIGGGAALLGIAPALAQATFLGPLQLVFKAILYVDPLAYFSSVGVHDSGVSIDAQIFLASVGIRAVLVWVIAAAALAIASVTWNRVEI